VHGAPATRRADLIMATLDDLDWLEGCEGVIEVTPAGESPMLISVELSCAEQREMLECKLQLLGCKYHIQGPTRLLVVPDET
jgi:hypothetical protein